jgi:hypothetical protein
MPPSHPLQAVLATVSSEAGFRAYLPVRHPSSGSSVISVRESTGPTPGVSSRAGAKQLVGEAIEDCAALRTDRVRR